MHKAKPVVAFLGPAGSYTHQATLLHFPPSTHTLLPKPTIPDLFHFLSLPPSPSDPKPQAVIPFENSTNGSVLPTLDLLASPTTLTSHLRIRAEIYLPVHHALCVHPSLPHPSAVKKLYSHPQAWGQCSKLLGSEPWKGVEKQDVSSTSRGAEMVAEEGDGSTSAAISSKVAGEMNGLKVLEDGVEDDVGGNCTRFLVLEAEGAGEVEGGAGGEGKEIDRAKRDEGFKSLVVFTVSHSEPGALADCLAVFKRFGLNLTSISTRPSGQTPWHYVFYVEFVGRKWEGDEEGMVNEALRELGKVALQSRWMGSWENGLLSKG